MSEHLIKVTSLASSSSGVPTPPHPTPQTDAAGDVESVASLDLEALGPILEPIKEALNEAAEAAKYPSPPFNTPAFTSPSPSVGSSKYAPGRSRGLSTIGDRLAKLKFSGRSSSNKSDTQSVTPSSTGEGEDEGGEFLITGRKDLDFTLIKSVIDKALIKHAGTGDIKHGGTGDIKVRLGAPAQNPRFKEYLTFQPSELPIAGSAVPDKLTQDRPVGTSESHKSHKNKSNKGGVSEKSNWAEHVIEQFGYALLKLEQLIKDEMVENPTFDAKAYYLMRLKEVLSDKNRMIHLDFKEKDGMLIIA